MKLIKPSFEILPTTGDVFKDIERVGRVCYKSEESIKEGTAQPFVEMLIKRGHGAMLEHGTVYLYLGPSNAITGYKYKDNQYSKYVEIREREQPFPILHKYITTNYRVLIENGWLSDLEYQCEPTEFHEKRVSVKFLTDRGITHEFVRHRVFSFAQESTRYCNYSKEQYGKELTFILPPWVDFKVGSYSPTLHNYTWTVNGGTEIILGIKRATRFLKALSSCEEAYLNLMDTECYSEEDKAWIAQQARDVLPNSLKTELIMTGTVEQWKGFFKLRCNADAHPQARELAMPLQEEFKRLGYVS